MGTLRVCKWLPKRNVSQEDQTFLVQTSDDLRYRNEVFSVNKGVNAGYYRRLHDLDIEDRATVKLLVDDGNDSGICQNCSAISGQSIDRADRSDPDFVEVSSFSESDTEYEKIVHKTNNVKITSSTNELTEEKPASLDASTISNDTLEKRKSFDFQPSKLETTN